MEWWMRFRRLGRYLQYPEEALWAAQWLDGFVAFCGD